MIRLENVSKSFNNAELLKNISFSVDAGARVSILGPGGCGKSTLLKILLGLVQPDEGDATLLDVSMTKASEDERREVLKRVGMAFQQGALFDFMTVEENLDFAMEHMTSLSPEDMRKKSDSLLGAVKLPRSAKQFPFELSGGMQRRVGIARALATDPEIAIFDEPTSGLDPVTSTIILNMILNLAGSRPGSTQVVATSNVEIAIRFADRIIMIADGKIAADGSWQDLLMDGPDWVRHFLGVRLIGLDLDYARELHLPDKFIAQHWGDAAVS